MSESNPGAPRSPVPSAQRRKLMLALGGLLFLLTLAFYFLHGRGQTVRYITATADLADITRAITATGTVNPQLTIIVGSYVSGVIEELYCDYNTRVTAGQICAKIDPGPYQAALDQYTGQLQRDQAILQKDRVNLARYQGLAAMDSIARQQAEDQAFVVKQDEGTVKLDQGLVAAAKRNLSYTNIVSPVNGTVVSRNVTQGQTVAASFQTPTLFLIASDLKKMQVDTNVSESDIGSVRMGQNATFTVDAYPNRLFRASVTQVRQSPQTVQNVVTYDVVATVDNNDLALRPGMTASTQIVTAQKRSVLRVPDQALRYMPSQQGAQAKQQRNGPTNVWVLRDGHTSAVAVDVGLNDGNYAEIISGDLKAGDTVIIGEAKEGTGTPLPTPRL